MFIFIFMFMQHGYASKDTQYGTWTRSMEHAHAAWTHSMETQHGNAA
jgi:hypothetical protein